MTKTIIVTAEIAVVVGDETLVLTRAEAEQLRNALNQALTGTKFTPPGPLPSLPFPPIIAPQERPRQKEWPHPFDRPYERYFGPTLAATHVTLQGDGTIRAGQATNVEARPGFVRS